MIITQWEHYLIALLVLIPTYKILYDFFMNHPLKQ